MKNIQIITTNTAAGEYWKETSMPFQEISGCMNIVNVYPELTGQTIEGFGGAVTQAAALNYESLNQDKKIEFMEACYGDTGLRYNFARITINSCDFGEGNYTYVEDRDMELKSFSISHDREYMIPMMTEAIRMSQDGIRFMASPWSPPAFMKTNNDMNHGGKLKKECRQAWADYFVKYLRAYEAEGIPIESITVQNEPMAAQTWDSCMYEPDEEQDFVRNYLGPTLRSAGLSHVGIYIWDHNKEDAYDRAKAILDDKVTRDYTAGVAVHWYTGDHFEALQLIRDRYPGQKIFFTEGCVEFSRFADSGEVQKAQMYAHDMMGNLLAGANGILDWNLLLDENGGPNHVGNFCASPLMCNGEGDFEKRLSYYYIGHFSRYIRQGARKIALTRYTDQLEASGFLNPDGERVIVLLNRTQVPIEAALREAGAGISLAVPAFSIVTVRLPG